jgi:hypothetical protein
MIRLDHKVSCDPSYGFVLGQRQLDLLSAFDTRALAHESRIVGDYLKALVDFLQPLIDAAEHRLVPSRALVSLFL